MGSKVLAVLRILLGLMFVVTGLNRFVPFAPMPPMPERATAFIAGLDAVPYFWKMEATVGIIAGILLIAGRYVPLALALLAPLLVNIMALHIFEAQASIGPAAVMTLIWGALIWSNRAAYAPLLTPKLPAAN